VRLAQQVRKAFDGSGARVGFVERPELGRRDLEVPSH